MTRIDIDASFFASTLHNGQCVLLPFRYYFIFTLADVFVLDFGYKDYKVVEMSAAAFFPYTFYTSETRMGVARAISSYDSYTSSCAIESFT